MALSLAWKKWLLKIGRGNSTNRSGVVTSATGLVPEKRMLKRELKVAHRTKACGKHCLEMFHRMAERIRLGGVRFFLPAT